MRSPCGSGPEALTGPGVGGTVRTERMRGPMGRRMHRLRWTIVAGLVFQLGLTGTLGWLHLAGHEHAFSPDLQLLTDVDDCANPDRPGLRLAPFAKEHGAVLLALTQASSAHDRPLIQCHLVFAPPPVVLRDLLPTRNPAQRPILAVAPSQSPPSLA